MNPDNLQGDQFYKMSHQPDPDGAYSHDLSTTVSDFYKNPHYYHYGERSDKESVSALMAIRGKPDAEVTIYRAVPAHVKSIDPGNWVSFSRTYATEHGYGNAEDGSEDMPVISRKVRARDVRWEGNSVNEFGYFPED